MRRRLLLATLFGLLLPLVPRIDSGGMVGAVQRAGNDYELTRVMIPMRDGVRLNTHIFRPRNQSAELPIMLKNLSVLRS
ncbi:MAG: hypothetical protein EBZ36_15855 [Acidobacteria bacterium]|nr:hypothetical protein [Acidobacteriota bacterium]